jgi:hypothetical protein
VWARIKEEGEGEEVKNKIKRTSKVECSVVEWLTHDCCHSLYSGTYDIIVRILQSVKR